jgi:capsid protein
LRQATYARAIDGVPVMEYANAAEKFEAVSFKPRGWSWVDPTKEVEAYKEAVKAGFTTRADVIAQTGGGVDIEEVDAQRERELESQKERGLKYDTDPEAYEQKEPAAPAAAPETKEPEEPEAEPAAPARVLSLRR